VCIIHATNGKASLAHCPSLQLSIPHPLIRELIKHKASCMENSKIHKYNLLKDYSMPMPSAFQNNIGKN
jgi:hypothetical protein